jgi:hypothetical protein
MIDHSLPALLFRFYYLLTVLFSDVSEFFELIKHSISKRFNITQV